MSLDNTSNPGRPGLDELVPSRYALKVGGIDVMVVSDGVLSLPGAMLGHNADPALRPAFKSYMPSQAVRSSNASHVNVAQNGAEERGAAAPNAM